MGGMELRSAALKDQKVLAELSMLVTKLLERALEQGVVLFCAAEEASSP